MYVLYEVVFFMLLNQGKSLIFISQWGSNIHGINGGNVKKAFEQIKTFERNGFKVKKVLKEPNEHVYLCYFFKRIKTKLNNIFPFCTNHSIVKYGEVGVADCYYIRFRGYDYYFYKLLKKIKENNPECKVILEYSDYPYLALSGRDIIGDALVKFRDEYNRKKCMKYVDRIATLLNDTKIDGKACIKILNGIDLNFVKLRKHNRLIHKELHVLIVASLQRAHGVDLFIEGMKNYYREKKDINVFLHIVGGGSILNELKELAKPLENKVIFYGFVYDEELDRLYDLADIGIEILAPGRRNITISASLKSREYIARGLPFISACDLDVSAFGFNEYYHIEDNGVAVDIDGVIKYTKSFYANGAVKMKQMRAFAEQYLCMDYAMKEVIQYFKSS